MLRLLLDLHIDLHSHVDEEGERGQNTWDRPRTPWEASLPILLAAFRTQIPGFEIEGKLEGALREHLAKCRLDGLDLDTLRSKTGEEFQAYHRGMPLVGLVYSLHCRSSLPAKIAKASEAF